jgi:hypothetical protein
MIEVTIYVPAADNDGATFTPTHHAMFEAFILDRFGGLTRATQEVEGVWKNQDGRTFTDRNLVYLVALQSILEGERLREVLGFAKLHYRQEAIFFRYLGIAEIYE